MATSLVATPTFKIFLGSFNLNGFHSMEFKLNYFSNPYFLGIGNLGTNVSISL